MSTISAVAVKVLVSDATAYGVAGVAVMRRVLSARPKASLQMTRPSRAAATTIEGARPVVTTASIFDELDLVRRASQESIFLAPGRVFAAGRDERKPATRLNVAHACDPRFLAFLRRHVFMG